MFMIQEEIKLLMRLQELQGFVTIVAFVNICPFVFFCIGYVNTESIEDLFLNHEDVLNKIIVSLMYSISYFLTEYYANIEFLSKAMQCPNKKIL